MIWRKMYSIPPLKLSLRHFRISFNICVYRRGYIKDHRVMWQEIWEKKKTDTRRWFMRIKRNSAINKKCRWDFIFKITSRRRNDNTVCHYIITENQLTLAFNRISVFFHVFCLMPGLDAIIFHSFFMASHDSVMPKTRRRYLNLLIVSIMTNAVFPGDLSHASAALVHD